MAAPFLVVSSTWDPWILGTVALARLPAPGGALNMQGRSYLSPIAVSRHGAASKLTDHASKLPGTQVIEPKSDQTNFFSSHLSFDFV